MLLYYVYNFSYRIIKCFIYGNIENFEFHSHLVKPKLIQLTDYKVYQFYDIIYQPEMNIIAMAIDITNTISKDDVAARGFTVSSFHILAISNNSHYKTLKFLST